VRLALFIFYLPLSHLSSSTKMGVFLRLGFKAGIRLLGEFHGNHGCTTVEVGPERLLLATAGRDDRVGIGHRAKSELPLPAVAVLLKALAASAASGWRMAHVTREVLRAVAPSSLQLPAGSSLHVRAICTPCNPRFAISLEALEGDVPFLY
jgi:hypothetical protein